MSLINTGDFSYKKLPIRYVTPLELTAMALKAGMKRWTKAQEEGVKRLDPAVNAVYMGCEIRVCLPRDLKHVADCRGDDGWMLEAGISRERPRWLHKAQAFVKDSPDVIHLDDGLLRSGNA